MAKLTALIKNMYNNADYETLSQSALLIGSVINSVSTPKVS